MSTGTVSLDTMTADAKRGLLAALIRDLTGGGRVPLTVKDAGGEYLICPVADPRASVLRAIAAQTPEERAEDQRRAARVDEALSFEETLRLTNRPR